MSLRYRSHDGQNLKIFLGAQNRMIGISNLTKNIILSGVEEINKYMFFLVTYLVSLITVFNYENYCFVFDGCGCVKHDLKVSFISLTRSSFLVICFTWKCFSLVAT